MRKLLFAAAAISLAAPAAAANWEYIGTSTDGSEFYIDISSVRNGSDYSGSYKSAWFKTDDSRNKYVKYRSSKILYRAKCDKYELGMAQFIAYDADGRVSDSSSSRYVTFDVVAPETVGYSLLTAICWGV